ncbi:MAG: VTT domain-containing protein [Chloroflexaceae bacterium]|nr:VTT domain-containing protein [Chloroflexaceae bacterium]
MHPAQFLRRHWHRLFAGTFWLIAAGGSFWYATRNGAIETLLFLSAVYHSPYGPLIYLCIFAIRPLIFFPISVLVLVVGGSFGLMLGVPLTLAGVALSGTIAYALAMWFGSSPFDPQQPAAQARLHRYIQRMCARGFETVLIMHFLFLPFDLVNYLAGFLRIRYRSFFLATVLGWIPGSIFFVTLGQSIDRSFSKGVMLPAIEPWAVLLSGVVLSASLLGAYLIRRREQRRAAEYTDQGAT